MITPQSEASFWNQTEMVIYFASKDPDPRIVDRMSAIEIHDTSRGLDLGCGGGRHTVALAEAGFMTTAIDINPAMLAHTAIRARRLSNRISLSFGTICEIPLTDNAFDFVVSTGVLHQARSAEAMDRAICEIARVSRKGAVFIGNLFVKDVWDDTYTIPDTSHPEYVETLEHIGMTLVDADTAIDMFQKHGFVFEIPPVVDFKQENTGPRGVFRFSVELTR